MAYSVAWDETAPDGATVLANTLDTELQNLKISIRERLDSLIDDFDDDGVTSKVLNKKWIISAGNLASRPASPTRNGEAYFSQDQGLLHVGYSSTWKLASQNDVYAAYDADAATVSGEVYAHRTVFLKVTGTTGATGLLTVDFSKLAAFSSPACMALVVVGADVSLGVSLIQTTIESTFGLNTIDIGFYDDSGTAIATTAVTCSLVASILDS